MRRRIIVASAAVALLAAVSTVKATSVQCLNCSDAQMYAKARALGASAAVHIVWNPANGNIKRYRNYCGSAPNAAPTDVVEAAVANGEDTTVTTTNCRLQTEEHEVAAEQEQVAQALSEVWRGTGGTFRSSVEAPVGGIVFPAYLPNRPTAHDFLMDRGLQGELLDLASTDRIFHLDPNSALRTPLAFLASHIDAFLAMSQGVIITVDVIFHDASKVQLRLTIGDNATYVANSARDGSGHTLPDPNFGTPAYPGRWYFPPGQTGDMAAFIEYMRSLGVTITSGGSAGNGVITCTWNQTNNTTTCYIPR
ncbi:MAG TPA: hypothetical protein VM555_09530 [Tahibacter sp.]|nr:hypothetical protein [Tahibacter sp.]